jgi:hypothetical protein
MVQLVKISDSPCSRGKDAPHIRTQVWLKSWTIAPSPTSITLLTVHPNKSRLLLVLGEEDGEFMVIMRTGLHEVEVLVTK